MSLLGNNLRTLRLSLGKRFSVQVVADAIEVPRSNLNGWELGVSEPRYEHLLRLARYYKVSIDRLLRTDLSTLSSYSLGVILRQDADTMENVMKLNPAA